MSYKTWKIWPIRIFCCASAILHFLSSVITHSNAAWYIRPASRATMETWDLSYSLILSRPRDRLRSAPRLPKIGAKAITAEGWTVFHRLKMRSQRDDRSKRPHLVANRRSVFVIRPGYFSFYQISYMWYSAFAVFVTSIGGLLFSFITGRP